GRLVTQRNISLNPYAGWSGMIADLMPDLGPFEGYAIIDCTPGSGEALIGFETWRGPTDFAGLTALTDANKLETGYSAHFTSQAGYTSSLVLVNYGDTTETISVTAG